MPDKKKYMKIAEYGCYKDVNESTIYASIRNGKIERIESGKHKGKIDVERADELWIKNTKRVNNTVESPESKHLIASRARKEAAIAEREELRTKKMKEQLLDRTTVLNRVQTIARQNRDMWLNWPKLVAVRLAEEFGADSGLVYDVLDKEIRDYLNKVATLDMDDAANFK